METAPKLSNGTNFNDLEWPLTPISTSNNSKMVQDRAVFTMADQEKVACMVYRTAPFSMTLTPNHRVRVREGKVRKPYPNFQMVPLSMTLSDLWPTFQGHDNIQRPITRLIVSRVWSVHWFRYQWPWVTLNVDFKVTEMPSTNCVRRRRAICLR